MIRDVNSGFDFFSIPDLNRGSRGKKNWISDSVYRIRIRSLFFGSGNKDFSGTVHWIS